MGADAVGEGLLGEAEVFALFDESSCEVHGGLGVNGQVVVFGGGDRKSVV